MFAINLALVGCGAVLASAGWSFVDATSNTKYVCADSSDVYITASRALDWAQVASAISTIVLTLSVAITDRKERVHIENWVAATAGFTGVVIAVSALLTGTVCQSQGCVTSESATLAETEGHSLPFITEVNKMIGATTVPTAGYYPCFDKVNPMYFLSPLNWCPETLHEYCRTPMSTHQPYRCMVYTCSDLVPGATARYTLGMIGLVLQLAICGIIGLHEGSKGKPEPSTRTGMDVSLTSEVKNLTRQLHRRHNSQIFYSDRREQIAF